MVNLNEENCIVSYTEKMITEIISKHDKETLKTIERYCEENNIIPNIIEKEKLDLVLKLGIAEYNKKFSGGRNKNMKTIIKQSADGIVLIGDNKLDTTQGKVFINNHEITDIDTFFKVAEENTRLLEQVKKQKEVIDEAINRIIKETKSMPTNGCKIRLIEILEILNEASE